MRLSHGLTVLMSLAVWTCASPASPQRDEVDRGRPAQNTPDGWALSYSSGTTLSTNGDGQQVVTMPTKGTVNMLTRAWTGSDVGKMLYVTVLVQTTGTPLFQLAQGPEPTCSTPPSTRPYMEEVGWERMPPNYQYARWWSRQGFMRLGAAGSFSLAIPLTPDRWSGVSGQFATENDAAVRGFTSIVTASQPSRIGLVFGGGCSYGHGLSVSGGSATLTITEFEAR